MILGYLPCFDHAAVERASMIAGRRTAYQLHSETCQFRRAVYTHTRVNDVFRDWKSWSQSTSHRYGGYEIPRVSTREPTLVLPFREIISLVIFTSPLGHRWIGGLQGGHSICVIPSHKANISTSSIAVFVILAP